MTYPDTRMKFGREIRERESGIGESGRKEKEEREKVG